MTDLLADAAALCQHLASLEPTARIPLLNTIRQMLHAVSPFQQEPVDCVQWVPVDAVFANDYNPNTVAPPEMRLLQHSIEADHFTQPIVAMGTAEGFEVIDGFHRHRVGREVPVIASRLHGYLPLALINADRHGRDDRIAATIRHNRARGKHQVQAMSEIVQELHRRNWSDEKIARELGMDADEVLRLKQITGLAALFAEAEFSEAWEADQPHGRT